MLVSSCRNITNKTIIKHAKNRDGITAWVELCRDFEHDGSKTLRMEALADIIGTDYKANHTGSLAEYLDQFLSAFHELELLGGDPYSESQKKRTLLKDVRGISGMAHLVQKCRDDFDGMTFSTMAQYLRKNSKHVEMVASSNYKEEDTVSSQCSPQKTEEHPPSAMKQVKVEHTTAADSTHVSRVGLCEKLEDKSTLESYETADVNSMPQAYMVTRAGIDDGHTDDTLSIPAHLEYTKTDDQHYAILDSGADSCILGLHCHVISHTGRNACLIGYDPATTCSAKVPIISGFIKVMSQAHIPIVLKINEAPYNANSPITLLSEYPACNNGTIIDSVSHHHKTISGTFGTQRMMVSPNVYVPFVDRGGLMGLRFYHGKPVIKTNLGYLKLQVPRNGHPDSTYRMTLTMMIFKMPSRGSHYNLLRKTPMMTSTMLSRMSH